MNQMGSSGPPNHETIKLFNGFHTGETSFFARGNQFFLLGESGAPAKNGNDLETMHVSDNFVLNV